jgi:hypothetical protein
MYDYQVLRAAPLADNFPDSHRGNRTCVVLLDPPCLFTTAKVLALKATVLLLLSLLIKAKV